MKWLKDSRNEAKNGPKVSLIQEMYIIIIIIIIIIVIIIIIIIIIIIYLDPREMRMGSGEGFTMRNFIVCTVHLLQSGWLKLEDWDGPGM